MKIALPVRKGFLDRHIEDADFFAILTVEEEKATLQKIIKPAALEKGYEGLARLLKEQGVDTVIVGDISAGALKFFNLYGLEVIPGASGEIEEVAYNYSKNR